jgi:hypothetical protein
MSTQMLLSLGLLLVLAGETFGTSRARDRDRSHDDWSDSESSDDAHVPNCADKNKEQPCHQKRVEVADVAIVGLGEGGITTAYRAMLALSKLKRKLRVVAFERKDEVGGVIRGSRLKEPVDYDGSFGDLYGDMTAQRTTQLSLGSKRRTINELGIPLLMSPFRSEVSARGVRLLCRDPNDGIALANNVNSTDFFRNSADWSNNAFKLSSACVGDAAFVGSDYNNDDTAPFRNLHRDGVLNEVPGENAYNWLLRGVEVPSSAGETYDNTTNNDYGCSGYTHPLTGKGCCSGEALDGLCPGQKNTGDDWRTFVGRELVCNGATSCGDVGDNQTVFNYDYVSLLEDDNAGFPGDLRNRFGHRSYQDFLAREWNTNNINGYIPGGERRLARAMWKNATSNGLDTYLGETVTVIDEMPATSQYKFRLETAKRVLYVRRRLFLNTPPYYLQTTDGAFGTPTFGRHVSGSLVERLRNVAELRAPTGQTVVRVLLQWAPGTKAWFWDSLFNKDGSYSYRQYGTQGCFSRIEFLDTPYHRCSNHMVPVYSDDVCKAIWMSYYNEWLITGDNSTLIRRAIDELKTSFPDHAAKIKADEVVHVDFTYVPNAWHLISREYDKSITNHQVRRKAAAPLGSGVPVSVVGESSAMTYEGWREAAERSAQDALERWASEDLLVQTVITNVFKSLYNIFKNPDGSIADGSYASVFAHTPPLRGDYSANVTLSNEFWWPKWNYTEAAARANVNLATAGPKFWCNASNFGIPNTPRGI